MNARRVLSIRAVPLFYGLFALLALGACAELDPIGGAQAGHELKLEVPADAFPKLRPGRTLTIGHSLVRYTEGNAVVVDVPAALERLRAHAVGKGMLASVSEHPRRVIASNGWAMEGYWDQDSGHEFRRSTLGIVRSPGLSRDELQIGGDFEREALRESWTPIAGGDDARWDTIVSINITSYHGPSSYDSSTESMTEFYDFMRTGVDPRRPMGERDNRDVTLVHYMGVPATDNVDRDICSLSDLYASYDVQFAGSLTVPMAHAFVVAARELVDGGFASNYDAALRSLRRDDHVHYSARGEHLAALTFYAAFYGDPRGLGVPAGTDVDANEAAALERAAAESYVRFDRYKWDPAALGCPPLTRGGDTPPMAMDASVPDASVPDASAPDASVPDASIPDASIPDADVPDASWHPPRRHRQWWWWWW